MCGAREPLVGAYIRHAALGVRLHRSPPLYACMGRLQKTAVPAMGLGGGEGRGRNPTVSGPGQQKIGGEQSIPAGSGSFARFSSSQLYNVGGMQCITAWKDAAADRAKVIVRWVSRLGRERHRALCV